LKVEVDSRTGNVIAPDCIIGASYGTLIIAS
jgi:hypothetical protein